MTSLVHTVNIFISNFLRSNLKIIIFLIQTPNHMCMCACSVCIDWQKTYWPRQRVLAFKFPLYDDNVRHDLQAHCKQKKNQNTYIACLRVYLCVVLLRYINTHRERGAYKQASEQMKEEKNIHNDLRLINNLVASFYCFLLAIHFNSFSIQKCVYTPLTLTIFKYFTL